MAHITETPSTSSQIFYLFGSEGTGKSAIAQTVAEYCKSNGTLGASFFSRESSGRNTDKNLIATLVFQLCVTVPELKRFILKAVEDDLSTFHKDMHTQVESLIVSPIVQANNEDVTLRYPIVIVVDGLDQCDDTKEQDAFLGAISGAMKRHRLPLSFLITSRPETNLVTWLNQDPTIHSLEFDKNQIQTKSDIEAYLRSEFERIRKIHHIPESPIWPSQANIQTLLAKTSMLFSYASAIMASIDDQKDTPRNRLETILRIRSSPNDHSSKSKSPSGLAISAATDPPKSISNANQTSSVFTGRVEVDGLRYRRRPNIGCDAIGQYPIGTKISITGFTEEGTTVVKGDARWARLSNGFWIALANGKYISWTGSIPRFQK